MHMAGAWTMNHKGETDWNIVTPPQPGLNGRTCHVPRGRFIGGSSGCNGTICVRGVKQDYDDWGVSYTPFPDPRTSSYLQVDPTYALAELMKAVPRMERR